MDVGKERSFGETRGLGLTLCLFCNGLRIQGGLMVAFLYLENDLVNEAVGVISNMDSLLQPYHKLKYLSRYISSWIVLLGE